MHLIWTILIGFVAGLIAKLITPGTGPGGFFLTAALGIAGSLGATYLGKALGWYQPGQSAGFIGAVVGAIVLLALFHLLRRA
ncbi:MAG: GlsB/YeaQ/YmgE family stress response membrane protein [Ideonella sp.]